MHRPAGCCSRWWPCCCRIGGDGVELTGSHDDHSEGHFAAAAAPGAGGGAAVAGGHDVACGFGAVVVVDGDAGGVGASGVQVFVVGPLQLVGGGGGDDGGGKYDFDGDYDRAN